jgi:hypothetical protein
VFHHLLGRAILAVSVSGAVVLGADPEPAWTFEQRGRTYVYTVTVLSAHPTDVLLDVLFQPRHVAAFSRSAGRLVVLQEDGDLNEVRFDTRKFIFKCSTTFRRAVDREAGSIEIDMTGFKAGWGKLAPHARSSRARYTVTDRGTFREVMYRQEVETDKPVSGYSLRSLRTSMAEFARDLDAYLQRPDLARGVNATPGVPR